MEDLEIMESDMRPKGAGTLWKARAIQRERVGAASQACSPADVHPSASRASFLLAPTSIGGAVLWLNSLNITPDAIIKLY